MLSVIFKYFSNAAGSKMLGRFFAATGDLRLVLDFFGEDFLGLTVEVLLLTFFARVRDLDVFFDLEDLGFLVAVIFGRRVFTGARFEFKDESGKGRRPRDRNERH